MDNTIGTNNSVQGAFYTLERTSGASNPVVYIKNTDRNMSYTYSMSEPRKLGSMHAYPFF